MLTNLSSSPKLGSYDRFLENIFNALRDGISILDRELNIVKVNYWMRQRYEHALPLEGKKCYQVYQQRDFICPWCPSIKTLKTGMPAEEIVPYVTDKGHVGWIELSTFPLRDEEDNLVGVIEHCKDITEKIKAEERTRLLAKAVEQSAEAILITDRRGRIIYLNPSFETITGYRREEVLHRIPNFLKDANREAYRDIWRTLREEKSWHGEVEIRHKDGHKLYIELSISPVRDEQNRISHFVAVLHDITQRVELEAHLRRSQKLEAIGRLAGGIAHDFNNILTATMGYAELLKKKVSDPVTQKYAENIIASIKRAGDLTKKLLTFSRHRSQTKRVFDLNQTLVDLYPMIRRLIEERIEIRLKLPPKPLLLKGDPSDIEQIVMNLVLNAAEALPQGGEITLEVREQTPPFPTEERSYAYLRVQDNGSGIPKKHLDYIFDPFFTTKETGSGLGLFVVYNTVKHMKGYITVHSLPGQGTTFEIYLPLSEDPLAPQKRPGDQSQTSKDLKGVTILVVEDENEVRHLLKEALDCSGAKILEAENADKALSFLQNYPEPIHLLLTDLVIPGGSGAYLAREALTLRPELKVLFISGYPKGQHLEKLPGFFLAKPFSPTELLKVIYEVLDP